MKLGMGFCHNLLESARTFSFWSNCDYFGGTIQVSLCFRSGLTKLARVVSFSLWLACSRCCWKAKSRHRFLMKGMFWNYNCIMPNMSRYSGEVRFLKLGMVSGVVCQNRWELSHFRSNWLWSGGVGKLPFGSGFMTQDIFLKFKTVQS